MPAILQHESDDSFLLRLSGVVKRTEFAANQTALAGEIDSGRRPRILVLGDGFQGWEKGADWNDLDFQLSHGDEIARIAIVGDPRWEPEALAFAGAGFRRAPVKFFPSGQEAQARTWLAE